MLPLVGIVALGLLIVGVKLFFLPGKSSETSTISSEQQVVSGKQPTGVSPEEKNSGETPGWEKTGEIPSVFTTPGSMQIAVPVGKKDPVMAAPQKPREENPLPPKPSNPPASSPGVAPARGAWGVQVGAFTQQGQAASLMQELQKTEKNVLITTGVVNGKTYYRVRVVGGRSRAEAEQLEKELRRKGYPTLVVQM
jgi:cell division protein FtsN